MAGLGVLTPPFAIVKAFLKRLFRDECDRVTEAATGRLLGGIGMEVRAGIGTFGYWIREDARGRGLAPAALRLLCRWAVDELGLERLQLVTIPGNTSSERVAEKVGFQREGLLRRYFPQRGTRVDVWMWSLLPENLP